MFDLVRNRFQHRFSDEVNICKANRSYVLAEDQSDIDCPCCVGVKITLCMQNTLIAILREQQHHYLI